MITKVNIVRHNCYSELLEAAMTNSDGQHLQTARSRFTYRTFSVGNSNSETEYELGCSVRICSISKGNCQLEEHCPAGDYKYSLLGATKEN